MKHTTDNIDSAETTASKDRRHKLRHVFAVVGIVVGSLVGLLILLVVAATLYLTPANLTRILNEKASEYFLADVTTYNVRFSIWSTFPHFYLEMDSLRIDSRTLDSISPRIRAMLPADADRFVSTGRIKGSVNVLKLLAGEVKMKSLTVDDLDLNLVAYDDSINNYNIIPSTGNNDFKVPRFTAGYIMLRRPHPIRYFSAVTATRATASLSKARIVRRPDEFSKYSLTLDGALTANVRGVTILNRFPFSLNGLTALRFHPFRVSFSNFAMNLGNTRGRLNMSMNLGSDMSINNLNYHIRTFDLTEFLHFIPGHFHPYINRISTDLMVEAWARLTAPYSFSASKLPSFAINFKVPSGTLRYAADDGNYSMRHSAIDGVFNFNGNEVGSSFFVLKPFVVQADGIAIRMKGYVKRLLDHPQVAASIGVDARLDKIGRLPALRQYALKGKLNADANISFGLDHLTESDIRDIALSGNASLNGFALKCASPAIAVKGDGLKITYAGEASAFSHEELLRSLVNASASMESVRLTAQGIGIEAENLKFSGAGATKIIDSHIDSRKVPYTARLDVGKLHITDASDSLGATLRGISLNSVINNIGSFASGSSVDARLTAKAATVKAPSTEAATSTLDLRIKASRKQPGALTPPRPAHEAHSDTASLAHIRHTAAELSLKLPPAARDFINSWDVAVDASAASGSFSVPAFPQRIDFSRLSLAATPDSVRLRSLALRSQASACRLSAQADGLRTAFNYGASAPLRIDANLDIDTLNINQLAYAYEQGQIKLHGPAALNLAKPDTVSGADTVTMLIPRNLDLRLSASAKETVYTNLHLYRLHTDVALADGLATVNNLRIASDFGQAYLDLSYDTRNIQNIGIDANLGLNQINVTTFFERFHSLLLMMPQMKNLSGFISAQVDGSMQMFPDMYVNVPSLAADLTVQGRGLKVHQNKFIRRITRMMLIPNSDDIHIRNMDVQATVHDNLLELYPFKFEFSKYKLEMQGLNNFNGRLFYHIGVMDNPLHLPFGINIQGYFHDPDLRFGGAHYPHRRSIEITSRMMEENRINIVRELKYYLKQFIHKAAQPGATL